MNHKRVIVIAALIISAMSGPARAELSSDAEAGPLSSADNGSEKAIFSLLDKYAADSQSPSASDASLIPALTKAAATMTAYYSITGSDNQQVVASVSAAPPYSATAGTTRAAWAASAQITAGAPLAALVQGGIPVGSNAMVSGESVAPLSGTSSSPIYAPLTNTLSAPASTPSVPIPLPFLLFGSGLTVLLGVKKRTIYSAVA